VTISTEQECHAENVTYKSKRLFESLHTCPIFEKDSIFKAFSENVLHRICTMDKVQRIYPKK